MTRDRELIGFVFDQAAPALDRGALLVLSLSDGGDLAWSVVPPGSDLELHDVRAVHRQVPGPVADADVKR